MNIRLDNKTALVCGGSQGIGRAVALTFAEMGASVTVVSRNTENLQSVLVELKNASGAEHHIIAADSSEPESFVEKIAGAPRGFAYDILVNNSGGPPGGAVLSAHPEEMIKAYYQHIIAAHMLTQKLVPAMKNTGFGRIINIISMSVRTPIENLGVSNTTRGAMASWAKTLARELAPFGITVNNILPGNLRTGRLNSLIKNNAEKKNISIEEMEKQMIATIPAGRFGHPEEAGWLAGFLASDYAAYLTGISIPVDGGKIPCI